MSRSRPRFAAAIRAAFLISAAIGVAACSSSEQRAQNYYDSGMKLLAAHEYQKAAVEFRNAVRLKRDLLPAWRGLAQTEEANQHWDGLVQVLREIVDLDPKDEPTRLRLAKFLIAEGAAKQTLDLLNQAGEASADDADLLALKAVAHYKLKDNDTAVREARSVRKIDPANTYALMVLAADRLASNDPNGALELLPDASPDQKQDVEIQLFKIQIYTQLKDYAHIESLLQDLTQRYPQNILFPKQLANLYVAQHRPQDAEKELRTIVAIEPKNPQFALDLVDFLYRVKGAEAAREELVAHIDAGGDVFAYRLAMAQLDYNQGKIDDSLKLLETLASSASPAESLRAKIVLAQFDLQQKKTDVAETIIADILAHDQRNIDALKLRASIRLDQDRFDAAITDLREALNDQPRAPELMLSLATAYERSGSIDLADKELADALRTSNFNPGVGLNYVAFLRRHDGTERANDVLTELESRWPVNVQILSARAELQLALQDWTGAQQTAETLQRIGDANIANEVLGAALSGEHQYDASIAAFQNAVTAAPTSAQPIAALVAAMIKAKRTDRAIAFLQSVLKQNSANAVAYVLLGNIELTNNTPDQAEKNFKAAIEAEPKNDMGYRALADLYVRQKNFDPALTVLRSGIKAIPDSSGLHLTLAGTLEASGDYEAAISAYEELLKQRPGSMLIANNLASLLVDHRTDKASLDHAQSLAARLKDSQIAQFKDTLGWVYYREGDFTAAVPLLEAAAEQLPELAVAHYHLGMCYIGVGQLAKASDQLKQALADSPGSELDARIKAGLKSIVTN